MIEVLEGVADYIGIVGVVLTLIAYYLLNIGKIDSMSISYLFLNFFGSCMLLFSLLFHWNLPSVLIEVAWIAISVIGIFRFYKISASINS